MHDNLVGDKRKNFFLDLLDIVLANNGKAIVVIEDTNYKPATGEFTPERDVINMFLERVHNQLYIKDTEGIVIVDRPSGSRTDEDKFLVNCLETIQSGTNYVKPEHILLNVLSTPSKLIRLLQVADVITSCTTAMVSGENRFSPPIFEKIKFLFHSDKDRIGGVGLKIHPDYKYV